jgi:hypothetical protein
MRHVGGFEIFDLGIFHGRAEKPEALDLSRVVVDREDSHHIRQHQSH